MSATEPNIGGTPTKRFAINEATKITLTGPGTVAIAKGPMAVLAVTAGAADFEHLEIKVGGDSASVAFHGGLLRNREPSAPIQYELTVPLLKELKLENALTGDASGIDGDQFKIELKGASTLSASDIRASEIEAKIEDGSRLTVTGAATKQKIKLAGGSIYQATSTVSEEVEVDADDGSEAVVRVGRRLKVKAADASSVTYYGDGIDLNVQTSNGAKFRHEQ